LRVPLTWSEQGLNVTKTFVFKRGQYAIALDYDVKNDGAADRKLASYSQILRHWEHASRSYFDVETYSFKGPAIYDGIEVQGSQRRERHGFEGSPDLITGGWLASLQHQFVTAIVPAAGQPYQYQMQVRDKEYLLSATGPSSMCLPAARRSFTRNCSSDRSCNRSWRPYRTSLERTVDFGITSPCWPSRCSPASTGAQGWSAIGAGPSSSSPP
jgi:YidC/Oxa1 family membrane protein insertase